MRLPLLTAALLIGAMSTVWTRAPKPRPAALSLYYAESGPPTAPAIVCLHGFGASTYTWREIRPLLASHYHVYEIDLKGFGRSPKPEDSGYSVHDQADLILQFIADHHLERLTVMGHSFGGGVALAVAVELTRTRAALLDGLVLLDAASFKQPLPFFVEVLRWPIFGRAVQSVASDKVQVRAVLKKTYFNDRLIPEASVETYAAALGMPGGKHALRETAKKIIPDDIEALTEAYKTIDVPTLIIWGRHDEIVPLAIGRRLHDTIPGSVFEIIEDAGHAPQEETPDEVRAALARFFRW